MNPAAAVAVALALEEGVHQSELVLFSHQIWVAVDWTGDVVAVRAALPTDVPRVKAELAKLLGLDLTPTLKLIDPDRPASRASVFLTAALQQRQPAQRHSRAPRS